jgi:hypothetical protein
MLRKLPSELKHKIMQYLVNIMDKTLQSEIQQFRFGEENQNGMIDGPSKWCF